MKRKCLKCDYCYHYDGEAESCGYGVHDGAHAIGGFCPKDGKRIIDYKEKTVGDGVIVNEDEREIDVPIGAGKAALRKAKRLRKEHQLNIQFYFS